MTIEATITAKALTNLVDAPTGRSTRGYATDIDLVGLDLYPNVAMLILEGRLFELTRNETYRLQARAIYAAIQPLKISDAPARYASPYAADGLKVGPHDVATLSSQGYLALALSILYEITGETRFIDEVDRVFDALEAMRGPWCVADVHAGETCTPACGPATSVCADTYCVAPTCSTGLLHHVVQGRLAQPSDGTFYCAGCNFEARYVIGYRRVLAGESF